MSLDNILQKYCNNVLHNIWLLLISEIMRPNLQKINLARKPIFFRNCDFRFS